MSPQKWCYLELCTYFSSISCFLSFCCSADALLPVVRVLPSPDVLSSSPRLESPWMQEQSLFLSHLSTHCMLSPRMGLTDLFAFVVLNLIGLAKHERWDHCHYVWNNCKYFFRAGLADHNIKHEETLVSNLMSQILVR